MPNVLDLTVAHELCIGCGVCAGVCPHRHLQMQLNAYGEYNPIEVTACDNKQCTLCQSVCPNLPNMYETEEIPNEDDLAKREYAGLDNIQHQSETGYYLKSLVGYVKNHERRIASASGGLLTWTLEQLIERGSIDYVIAVEPRKDETPLFAFRLCNTVEEVRHCSRSCYYPVEISRMIQYMQENDARYAIVALPCVAKAIRLAQSKSPKLRERIKYVLGLTCGQGKSTFLTEALCSMMGGNANEITQAMFRVKDLSRPASDFGFRCCTQTVDQSPRKTMFWKEGMDKLFVNRHFTLNGCFFCDDVFSECADASFMDAWLPEYFKDGRGHSLVICRKNELLKIMMTGDGIEVQDIPISKVIHSQRGVVKNKKEMPGFYIHMTLKRGWYSPYRRKSALQRKKTGIIQSAKYVIALQIARQSRQQWLESGREASVYQKKMSWLLFKLFLWQDVTGMPRTMASKLLRIFKNAKLKEQKKRSI